MSLLWVAVALMLPMLGGWAVWCALLGRPRGMFGWSAALGSGCLVGSVAWGGILTFFDATPTPDLFSRSAPWLAGFVLVAACAAWRWAPAPMDELSAGQARLAAFERLTVSVTVLVLLGAAVAIWIQATSLPTLTWDAWNAWLAKSKAWFYAGQFLPVRGFDDWLQASPGSAITTTAWVYPEALPRYVSWVVSAAGTWSDATAQSPWPAAWMALGLSCFGLLGLAGCRTSIAAVATTALLTLPLITAHASLAGYMDLWLAAMLLLAGSHWLRWHRSRSWRDAAFAVLCAGLLPAIKPEGAIWMLCLSAATVLVLLPRWLRWGMVLLGPLLWAVALPFGGLRVPLPGLGWLRLGWGEVEIPTRGVMRLEWHPVLDEVAETLFLMPNWSLFWYLAPLVVLLRWRDLRRVPALAGLGWFLAFGYAFLFLLFFFTDAAAWAENLTSINRVLMHIVPITLVWLTLLWAGPTAPRDTAPSTAV